jgi:glucose/arabinose dehydrogenase
LEPDGTVRTILGSAPEAYDPTELATAAPRGGYAGDGEDQPLEARFNRPYDVAVAPDGTLFIADTENSCVRKYKPGGRLTTVAGVCEEPGFDGDGGPADEAHIKRPYGIALDEDGNLYIADTYNHRIRVVYAK